MENTTVENTVERVQVAEPINLVDKLKDKFMPGYWKTKEINGESSIIKMDDMELADKIKALKHTEKQAAKYAKLQEIHMNKYEELLISLNSIDGMDEEQVLEAIKVVVTQ